MWNHKSKTFPNSLSIRQFQTLYFGVKLEVSLKEYSETIADGYELHASSNLSFEDLLLRLSYLMSGKTLSDRMCKMERSIWFTTQNFVIILSNVAIF